jgi:hypothetical protein
MKNVAERKLILAPEDTGMEHAPLCFSESPTQKKDGKSSFSYWTSISRTMEENRVTTMEK